jgi:hypothetical protein
MDNNPQRETRGDKLATTVKQIGVARGIGSLVNTVVFAIILVVMAMVFKFLGAPWFIWSGMLFIAAAIVALDIITLKRAARVDLKALDKAVPDNIPLEAEEYLVDTIPAVMRYGKARSTSVLGTGKVHTPENALLITNRAVFALTVPLLGVDKVVSSTDIGMNQWLWAYKDIGSKLQEMISAMPLEEVLKQCRAQRLMGLEEIKKARTYPFTQNISLKRKDGKKFGYSVRVKEDYLKAKEIFKIS